MSITAGVSDCHRHLGVLPAQRFYEPVVPAGAAKADVAELLAPIDGEDTERALIIPNYGVPDPDISFSFNELVVEATTTGERLACALWSPPGPRTSSAPRRR
ncbi:MAG: hypothetical protein M3Q39_09470 [Actinomycetota bacterium]|nr:hypothetical protein [Actinomycetota bacterium]